MLCQKLALFRNEWLLFLLRSYFSVQIRNQGFKISPSTNFQLNWTKDNGAQILTRTNTPNSLMTSWWWPHQSFNVLERFSPTLSSCEVCWQLKQKWRDTKGALCPASGTRLMNRITNVCNKERWKGTHFLEAETQKFKI